MIWIVLTLSLIPLMMNMYIISQNAVQTGEVSFGEGVGFFRWAKTVQGKTSPSSAEKEYPVLVTDILLPNQQDPDFPPGTVFKTTIWTISNGDDVITSFNWDPVSGIDPIRATPYISAGVREVAMNQLLVLLAAMMVVVMISML